MIINLTPAPATALATATLAAAPALSRTAPAALTAAPLLATPDALAPGAAPSAAASANVPATGGAAAPPSGAQQVAAADPVLQGELSRSLLREGDLPTGYTAQVLGQSNATLHNQAAGYGGFFINGDPSNPGPGGVGVIIAALAGFTDPASAQAQAANVRSSAVSSLGGGVTLDPVPGQPAVAGAQIYRIAAPGNAGGQLSGFAIAWQHGRVLVVLAQLGAPAPATADTLNILARKQDDRLRAAGL